MLAWGARVSPDFVDSVRAICSYLAIDPSWLMSCMAFETAETFRSDIRNAAGSGAVGLIQFMPSTAAALGTTTEFLAALPPTDQLAYVLRYFSHWAGKLHTLGDVYAVILWPAMVGKPDDFVVFRKADPTHPRLYIQNRGLDWNKDEVITRGEIVKRIRTEFDRGLQPGNSLSD